MSHVTHTYKAVARNPAALVLTGRCVECGMVTVFDCADAAEMARIESDWKRALRGALCASY